jgi:hypothetical protein
MRLFGQDSYPFSCPGTVIDDGAGAFFSHKTDEMDFASRDRQSALTMYREINSQQARDEAGVEPICRAALILDQRVTTAISGLFQ